MERNALRNSSYMPGMMDAVSGLGRSAMNALRGDPQAAEQGRLEWEQRRRALAAQMGMPPERIDEFLANSERPLMGSPIPANIPAAVIIPRVKNVVEFFRDLERRRSAVGTPENPYIINREPIMPNPNPSWLDKLRSQNERIGEAIF